MTVCQAILARAQYEVQAVLEDAGREHKMLAPKERRLEKSITPLGVCSQVPAPAIQLRELGCRAVSLLHLLLLQSASTVAQGRGQSQLDSCSDWEKVTLPWGSSCSPGKAYVSQSSPHLFFSWLRALKPKAD